MTAPSGIGFAPMNPSTEWLESDWWNDGQIRVPQNHRVREAQMPYQSRGTEIPAILYRPDDNKKYPAVLFQHGRAGMDDLVRRHAKRLAARGFIVLAPDIYAAHFVERPVPHDYGYETDVGAGLDHLLSLPDISTRRACLYSHTRGGYYTLKVAVTQNRQKDAAACYVSYYPHLQDPNAAEADQVYRYAVEADALILPAMIFIGEHEQYQRRRIIETAVDSMTKAGRDVRLFVYAGVGRGFDFRPLNVRTLADDMASKDAIMRAARFMRGHYGICGHDTVADDSSSAKAIARAAHSAFRGPSCGCSSRWAAWWISWLVVRRLQLPWERAAC